ncbi:ribosome biogenesis GTPase Der [Gilliamella sp. B14448G11]|uniref:ribosome biogenesis GTPase Der n=1 Tax=unclassified Gilliamella TaxID=2685620 RepID=UPI0018DE3AC2|nr:MULTISPECIES: ribosome biogenesis GTPase Der [unclassified Gilliamella]MBI0028028.1 ribosome biogenesis GTPase Der [Gilliamella sp. B14448G7]MBI0031350.1 ribosome biogenesis GTPase Der [Gilliamella sp. B14384G15]MBI0034739.1 ribosome biogenesis GTPase Der [Gilliamella sp. B14448G11]MBI0042235.1 ribosome biogenesis GTPase Der [Gilliamella sp. B14448G12]MBI0058715.1 ribosome biogenesis GTPase Der [Gilliamella sp. B14384G12]
MVPVIALVGRPNVGKSTLFNRLTRTRDALVADFPGLTRDRKYGRAEIQGHEYIVIDTGGIDGTEDGVESFMAEQSLQAIEEADIVLFLVDARAGAMPADHAIAKHLRSRQKATFLVANKIDGIDADIAISDFYGLGLGKIHSIAASHGRGVSSLIETVLEPIFQFKDEHQNNFVNDESSNDLPESYDDLVLDDDDTQSLINQPIKVAIVGRPNVGKSTLTNRILGEERVVVYDMPGTTRDSIYIPMTRDEREYVLIDTAGVRKRGKVTETVEKFSVIKTLQAIEDANVVILVIDAREGVSDQDLSLLGFIINSGRSLVIAVNKWDGLSQDIKEQVKTTLDDRLDFIDFARVHFISALHGSGVGNLFDSIQEAYDCATRRVNTALLTKIMQMAQDDHQPPLVCGRRVKLKYAHAGGYNPPIVVIHGNQVEDLPDSYKRYLMNYFRRSLKIMGSPIRIQFKEGANPFEGRKNSLTASQQRKRRRLMKHVRGRK